MQNVRRVSLAARCGQALGERKKSVGMAAFERKKSVIPTRRKSEEKQAEKRCQGFISNRGSRAEKKYSVKSAAGLEWRAQKLQDTKHRGSFLPRARRPLIAYCGRCQPQLTPTSSSAHTLPSSSRTVSRTSLSVLLQIELWLLI